MEDTERPGDNVFDERHWTKVEAEGIHPYLKSKTLAEKAAWDFLESLPEAERFELVAVIPSFIVGPSLTCGDHTSEMIIKGIMVGQ